MSAPSTWEVLRVLVYGGLLYAALRGARFGIDVAPLSALRREALRRAFPAFAGLCAVGYLLYVCGALTEPGTPAFWIAIAIVLLGSLGASWFALYDMVSGVFLKLGRVCQVGDYVRVGDVQGRVERMGARVLVVETARGEEAIIPYSRVVRDSVLRTPVSERGTLHVFELHLPGRPAVAETKRRIRESALLCHWAAVARDPEIAVLDADRYEVTVFALDADRVREVEEAVRAGVDASAP